MAKNRNKKRNGVVSMDTTDAPVSEQPQGTCFSPVPVSLLLSMLLVEISNENGRNFNSFNLSLQINSRLTNIITFKPFFALILTFGFYFLDVV